jgi:serine/threonine protein kinase
MIGELINHYRVLELVGRGAMGVVYKALDVNLDRQVAIKLMSDEARSDPHFVERFRQEARVQGALNHPNVAVLFDYFVHGGAPVAVMEFIDGESLEQLIRRRGPIPAHESIPIFKQALRGVAAAHRAGIVHRDLKPSNLMITKDNVVKVMDFGIAKRQGVTSATKASTSIGSPLYMAPEQILGRAVDCRTDVYALGITLYELLTAQRPFNPRGKPEYLVLDAHVNDLPEPPTVYRLDIPRPVVDAVMRSLAKEPDARFQSADDFMNALPDVPAPKRVAPPVDPSHTVALEYSPTMSGDANAAASARTDANANASVNASVNAEPSRTMAFEYASSTRLNPTGSIAFDYSAATLRQESYLSGPAPSPRAAASPAVAANVTPAEAPVAAGPSRNSRTPSAAPAPGVREVRGASRRPVIVAALAVTLVLGTLVLHHVRQLRASPPSVATHAGAVSPAAGTLATTTTPERQDLSGIWRGEYVDASGKQLLRVISLSISRVHDDGGVEGRLQYEAASGQGECMLRPRGSTWSAGGQRLQLSPEACSAHYPRELGVPLDFDGVNPLANTLEDGRIEAPTGEVVRVRLQRVSGA